MEISFRAATVNDVDLIGSLVVDLTAEICELTNTAHFDIDLSGTIGTVLWRDACLIVNLLCLYVPGHHKTRFAFDLELPNLLFIVFCIDLLSYFLI